MLSLIVELLGPVSFSLNWLWLVDSELDPLDQFKYRIVHELFATTIMNLSNSISISTQLV